MSTPTLHIPGAEPTIIDHAFCGCMDMGPTMTIFHTAVPDRNLLVFTWYNGYAKNGALDVWVLISGQCLGCGRPFRRPDPDSDVLYQKRYFPESRVTRGGLLEAHENAVVLAVQNRLPLGGGSLQRGRQG